jgi:L-ascorbate metabolism protein UlaG (beta-lactamase superfamily)
MEINGLKVDWLGHASVRITDGKVIYIDPYEIQGGPKADIIFITHSHYDHCSIADLKKISTDTTTIIATPDCSSKLSGKVRAKEVILAEPGKKYEVDGIKVEAVPAYNVRKEFHKKLEGWVGYIMEVNKTRIYHAGDTDKIPEMSNLKNIDIAFLPIGGNYTMDSAEAVSAADAIKPKLAVPIHYGSIVGDKADAEKFKALCKCDFKVLEKTF